MYRNHNQDGCRNSQSDYQHKINQEKGNSWLIIVHAINVASLFGVLVTSASVLFIVFLIIRLSWDWVEIVKRLTHFMSLLHQRALVQHSSALEHEHWKDRHAALQLQLINLILSSLATELSGGLMVDYRESPNTYQPNSKGFMDSDGGFCIQEVFHIALWMCAQAEWSLKTPAVGCKLFRFLWMSMLFSGNLSCENRCPWSTPVFIIKELRQIVILNQRSIKQYNISILMKSIQLHDSIEGLS